MTDEATSTPLTRRARREADGAMTASVTAPPHAIDEPAVVGAPVVPREDTAPEGGGTVPAEPALPDAPAANGVITVLRALGTGVMAALLVALLAIGVLSIVVPAATGSTALTVMTSSMEPAYPPGTMVIVRPMAAEDIVPGDVLTYQLHSGEPTLVTHRVTQQLLAQDGTYSFITKGDNNPQPDPDPIKEVQIKGTVWYAIPYLGWVSQAVTGDARGLVVPIVVLALFGYASFMIISSLRDKAKKRRESTAA